MLAAVTKLAQVIEQQRQMSMLVLRSRYAAA